MMLKITKKDKFCLWCQNDLTQRQKSYCCVSCQKCGVGFFRTKHKPFLLKCAINSCKNIFICIHKDPRKYCSKQCRNLGKSLSKRGDKNPMMNRIQSNEEKFRRSQSLKLAHLKDPTIRKRISKCNRKIQEKTGFYPGTDFQSRLKRESTINKKYGVKHVWQVREIRKKCEETTLKLYGQTLTQIASSSLCGQRNLTGTWPQHTNEAIKIRKSTWNKNFGCDHPWKDPVIRKKVDNTCLELYGLLPWQISKYSSKKQFTIPELITYRILIKNEIEFIDHYITNKKEYDFYLPNNRILIEIDGDYWHGFNLELNEMNSTQNSIRKNDIIKNEIAKQNNFRLLRFWEHEVKNRDFEIILLRSLNV